MRDTAKPTSRDPLDGFERWLDRRLPETVEPLAGHPHPEVAAAAAAFVAAERGCIEARALDGHRHQSIVWPQKLLKSQGTRANRWAWPA